MNQPQTGKAYSRGQLLGPVAERGGRSNPSYVSSERARKASWVSRGPPTASSLSHVQLDDFQSRDMKSLCVRKGPQPEQAGPLKDRCLGSWTWTIGKGNSLFCCHRRRWTGSGIISSAGKSPGKRNWEKVMSKQIYQPDEESPRRHGQTHTTHQRRKPLLQRSSLQTAPKEAPRRQTAL